MKLKISGLKNAQQLLNDNRASLALVIGNGINLVAGAAGGVSWDQLMEDLIASASAGSLNPASTRSRLARLLQRGTDGQAAASLPEIFDIIQAIGTIKLGASGPTTVDLNLQARIALMLQNMKPGLPHQAVVKWAWEFEVPVLTTNYDHCLQDALVDKCKKRCRR